MILFLINKKILQIKEINKLDMIVKRLNIKNFKTVFFFDNKQYDDFYIIKVDDNNIEYEIGKYNEFKKFKNTDRAIYINVNPKKSALFYNNIVYYI